jgi:hypothetical protein
MIDQASQLTDIQRQLDGALDRARRLADRVTDARWTTAPPGGGWSMSQCVMHLDLTGRQFLPLLREAMAGARRDRPASASPYRLDFWGWLLARMLEPPYRMKTKTMAWATPAAAAPRHAVLETLTASHAELAGLVSQSNGLPIDTVKIVSPFDPNGRLRYSVYSALRIIPTHERRHLWQAEQVESQMR